MKSIFLTRIAACIFFFFAVQNTAAQDSKLLLDKQGQFKIVDWGVYTHYNCGFTKAETTLNFSKLNNIVTEVRKNPVMAALKGFDLLPTFFAQNCDPKFGYGIPASIHFEFHTWSLYNKSGKEGRWDIEPPHWDIVLNDIRPFGNGQSYAVNKPNKDDCKPGFDFEKWKNATLKMREVFHTPGKKETIMPGIDIYGGDKIIFYNPARPVYWLPVTVKEMYAIWFDYYKNNPDEIVSDMTMKLLEAEYAAFSEEQKNSPAYFGGVASVSQVNPNKTDQQLVRANPLYWNKQLSKGAVQFMCCVLPQDKSIIVYDKEQALKGQGGSYHQYRFMESFDIKTLLPLIEKYKAELVVLPD